MRLIDADVLKEIIGECPENWTDSPEEVEAFNMWHRIMDDIDSAPTIGGWISVKDRLPEGAGYECLVCAVNENYNQTHVFTAHTGYGEPGWWTSNVHYMSRAKSPTDNSLHPALKVTHWMPLPEPPKEEVDNEY